jgi:thioredoxin 2
MATAAGAVRTVRCENCGRLNRVPVAAEGRPRCGRCQAYLPWIADAGDDDFTEVVERVSIPVLVDLWATWCAPCRMVSPALEQLARERAGRLKLVRVDIDRAPVLAQRFSVRAVPTLLVLHRGRVIARQPGAAPVHVLRGWLDEAITRIPADAEPGAPGSPAR